jgi:hypothetical protein
MAARGERFARSHFIRRRFLLCRSGIQVGRHADGMVIHREASSPDALSVEDTLFDVRIKGEPEGHGP